jgi:hypothetical protein
VLRLKASISTETRLFKKLSAKCLIEDASLLGVQAAGRRLTILVNGNGRKSETANTEMPEICGAVQYCGFAI